MTKSSSFGVSTYWFKLFDQCMISKGQIQVLLFSLGFHPDTDLGIPSNISSVTLVGCNSSTPYMTQEDMREMNNLVQGVRPFLNDTNSFKIILLLLLTESEYSPSFKRLHTALASAILGNASGPENSRSENEILTPYYRILQNTKRIHQLISGFIRDFCPQ